jgi:hypothetical protein
MADMRCPKTGGTTRRCWLGIDRDSGAALEAHRCCAHRAGISFFVPYFRSTGSDLDSNSLIRTKDFMFSWLRSLRTRAFLPVLLFALLSAAPSLFAQAAIFVEQPFGLFGRLNPTGHTAVYVEHICAATPRV